MWEAAREFARIERDAVVTRVLLAKVLAAVMGALLVGILAVPANAATYDVQGDYILLSRSGCDEAARMAQRIADNRAVVGKSLDLQLSEIERDNAGLHAPVLIAFLKRLATYIHRMPIEAMETAPISVHMLCVFSAGRLDEFLDKELHPETSPRVPGRSM